MNLKLILLCFFLFIPFAKGSETGFKQAYQVFLKKDYSSAQKLIQSGSLPPNHPLTDYSLWILGKSSLENKNYETAITPLQKLVDSYGSSLFHSSAKIALAKIYFEKEEYTKIKELLSPKLNAFEEDLKGEALYYLGMAEIQSGEESQGILRLKEAYLQYPTSSTDDEIESFLQNKSVPSFTLTPQDRLERANHFFEAKSFTKAIGVYEILLNSSDRSIANFARIRKGISLYRLKKYPEAIPLLINAEKLKLSPELEREALFSLGNSYQRLDKTKEGISVFERVQSKYPQSDEGEESLFKIGKIKIDEGNFSEATSILEKLIQTYPQGKFRDRAAWTAAWSAYRLLNWDQANRFLTLMEKGATDDPTKAKALYWKAKILEKQEKHPEAKEIFQQTVQVSPFSYYGFMALKQLKDSKELSEAPSIPKEWKILKTPPFPKSKKVTSWIFGDHYRKATALYSLGFGKESLVEFDALIEEIGEDPNLLLETMKITRSGNIYYMPVRISQKYWETFKKAFQNGTTAEQYRTFLQYPSAYSEPIQKSSREFSVPSSLILALIKQESAFQSWVVSPANAQGLMQLLPSTAQQRTRKNSLPMGDLLNPSFNIRIGTAELAAQLKRYSENWSVTLIAYNAGPKRATEWLAQNEDLQIDEFIEEIPFSETNLYVKLVLRNYWVYKTLY